jgi:hypothetical protein
VFGIFVVGYDQGQIFIIVQGNEAYLIKVLEFRLNTKRYPAQSAAIHILLFLSTVIHWLATGERNQKLM